jgi:DNA segregation ATPase FtsK/SpoIIIE, S-DNA-T family
MAERTGTRRRRGSTRSRVGPSRSRSTATGTAARRTATPEPHPLEGLGRAIAKIAKALARAIGWLVRRAGRRVEVAVEARRDGTGLVLMLSGALVAAAVWLHLLGEEGHTLDVVLRSLIGLPTFGLPVILVGAGVRMMRGPRPPQLLRSTIGWANTAAGVTGLLDLLVGGAAHLVWAGGVLGRIGGGLLAHAITNWLTVPLLIATAGYGVLTLTRTSVGYLLVQIPVLWAAIRHRTGTGLADDDDLADEDDEDDDPAHEADDEAAVAAQGATPADAAPLPPPLPPPPPPRRRGQGRRGGRPARPRPRSRRATRAATTTGPRSICCEPASRCRAARSTTSGRRPCRRCSTNSKSMRRSVASAAAPPSPASR